MIRYLNPGTPCPLAEVEKEQVTISSAEEMLDIMADAGYNGCSGIIIHAGSFSNEFYDLGTGVAGEILQKFSNYRMRLAVVGDFSHLTGKSWRDFIREANRGTTVNFLPSVEEAIARLSKRI
jgi:hypothetical protein